MEIKKLSVKKLIQLFVEEMGEHHFYGASAFYDELMRRGYSVEFHKRRVKDA